MKELKIPKDYYQYYNGDTLIVQIGCGGTGSQLVPFLARFASQQCHKWVYHLIDGDKVEKKNILRQNFVNKDVGLSKSSVLGSRYGGAFGIDMCVHEKYVETEKEVINMLSELTRQNLGILITCVDNNKTRQLIYNTIESKFDTFNWRRFMWIDVGNELKAGQVFITGESQGHKHPRLLQAYPDLAVVTDKLPTEQSCAERLVSGEQSLAVNATAALMVFNTIAQMTTEQKLTYYEINFNVNNTFTKKFIDDWKDEKPVLIASK